MTAEEKYKQWLSLTRGWCARRDRCTEEVRQRLQREGASDDDLQRIIAQLVSESFLDDRRYAESFVSGHFRMKGWGRLKIQAALRMKKVSESLIAEAMASVIDEPTYWATAKTVVQKEAQRQGLHPAGRQKIIRHASSKGFEYDVIYRVLDEVESEFG
jgi:regulatory protein